MVTTPGVSISTLCPLASLIVPGRRSSDTLPPPAAAAPPPSATEQSSDWKPASQEHAPCTHCPLPLHPCGHPFVAEQLAPSKPMSQKHAPCTHWPRWLQSPGQSCADEQSSPTKPGSQSQLIASKPSSLSATHVPRPQQWLGQLGSAPLVAGTAWVSHAAPAQPGAHPQTPSWHTPCRLHSEGHAFSSSHEAPRKPTAHEQKAPPVGSSTHTPSATCTRTTRRSRGSRSASATTP